MASMHSAFSLDDLSEEQRRMFSKKPVSLPNNELVFTNTGDETSSFLRIQDLSFGEKQFFIMLSEAFLERNQQVILIIDEPELSLHVTWQARLVNDIISLNSSVQFVMATHSPDIVQSQDQRIFLMENGLAVR